MKLEYELINENNINLATSIQYTIFPDECAYFHYKESIDKNNTYNWYYIIKHNGIPVGITGLYIMDDIDKESIWLGWFGILPEYRSKGFGRQSLLDIIEKAKKFNKKYFRLYTNDDGTSTARPLYRSVMQICENYNNANDYNYNGNCYIYSYGLCDEDVKPWNNRFMNLKKDIEAERKGNLLWPQIQDSNNMVLKKVDIKEFKKVIYPEYKKIFPSIERKLYTEIEKAYNNNLTDIIEIIVEDQFVGFFIINHLKDNTYVVLDYFAILPEYQRKGYGSNAMKQLKEMYKEYDGIFVEVEKPENEDNEENELREQRVKFYEKLEFCKMGFELELFTVNYFAYILPCSKDVFSNEDVVKSIFEIYNAVSGEQKIKKNCKVVILN